MKIPGFILKRLYVKSSLRRVPGGFQFHLRNSLGSGYAKRVLPLKIDAFTVLPSKTSFEVDGKSTNFEDVDESTPFTLGMNKTTTIRCEYNDLSSGLHTIEMSFEVAGLGILSFSFSDFIE